MQVTHEEVRKLIQLNADHALHPQEKNILVAHLEGCPECRAYAEEIKEVENILVPLMKKQWNLQPAPLSSSVINIKGNSKIQTSLILATRTAAIGIVFLAFIFSAWQFTRSGKQLPSQLTINIPMVPTPSAQSTTTRISSQTCAGILYVVQENDTLESIAQRFAVSKEEIMASNNIRTERIHVFMKLMIPVCDFTPTGTVNPTLFSTTYTPSIRPITSTPAGG